MKVNCIKNSLNCYHSKTVSGAIQFWVELKKKLIVLFSIKQENSKNAETFLLNLSQ